MIFRHHANDDRCTVALRSDEMPNTIYQQQDILFRYTSGWRQVSLFGPCSCHYPPSNHHSKRIGLHYNNNSRGLYRLHASFTSSIREYCVIPILSKCHYFCVSRLKFKYLKNKIICVEDKLIYLQQFFFFVIMYQKNDVLFVFM